MHITVVVSFVVIPYSVMDMLYINMSKLKKYYGERNKKEEKDWYIWKDLGPLIIKTWRSVLRLVGL